MSCQMQKHHQNFGMSTHVMMKQVKLNFVETSFLKSNYNVRMYIIHREKINLLEVTCLELEYNHEAVSLTQMNLIY